MRRLLSIRKQFLFTRTQSFLQRSKWGHSHVNRFLLLLLRRRTVSQRDMQMSLITGSGRITRCFSLPFAYLHSSGRREGSSHLCSSTSSPSNLHLRAIAHATLLTRTKCVSLHLIFTGYFTRKWDHVNNIWRNIRKKLEKVFEKCREKRKRRNERNRIESTFDLLPTICFQPF